jgi:hypothetical protein
MPTTPSPFQINITGATLEVNDVVNIVETDPVLDAESGDWVRDIQIFREPDEGADNPTLILTIRLKGEQKSNIHFHAPEQDY